MWIVDMFYNSCIDEQSKKNNNNFLCISTKDTKSITKPTFLSKVCRGENLLSHIKIMTLWGTTTFQIDFLIQ